MTHAAYPALASRRRRWPLFLIVAVVVGLAAAWTGLWFYAAAKAKSEIAAWRERESRAGRLYDCASEAIGGYPFRLEWRCGAASSRAQRHADAAAQAPAHSGCAPGL